MNLYLGPFCVISSVVPEGGVKLDCLDVHSWRSIPTTVSSVQEADRIVWPTFCIFAGIVMTLPLLLVILNLRRTFGRSAIRQKVREKMESFGSLPLDPDLEGLFPPHLEDFH